MTTILDDYLDAEFDGMTTVSIDKYEANLFMTVGRAAQVTRLVAAGLKSRILRGKYDRGRLATDSVYRQQVLDDLVNPAVRRVYTEVMTRAGDIKNPRPGHGLVRELARAYRVKARHFGSIVSSVLRGLGGLFEDEGDRMRDELSPRALAQAALSKARALRRTHLRVRGMARGAERALIKSELETLKEMVEKVIGSGNLTQDEIDEIGEIETALEARVED